MEKGTSDHSKPDRQSTGEDPLDTLFKHASSRPAPSVTDRRAVHDAVHEEWLQVTAWRRWRHRAIGFSAAAAVVLAVTLLLLDIGGQVGRPEAREMARVEKITGPVRVITADAGGDGADLAIGTPIYVAQSLRTGGESGIALRLANGLSLRVDEHSELDLIDDQSVKLLSGRVYVDTGTDGVGSSSLDGFELLTARGTVRHVGTQYMVRMDGARLAVSVRLGAVQFLGVEDGGSALVVSGGQEVSVTDRGGPKVSVTDTLGDQWKWAEALGPGFALDGRSMDEFLAWVARETGLGLKYRSFAAKQAAEQTALHGTVDLPAREALDIVIMGTDLAAKIEDGVIEISVRP
jgi:ferric-dicitrate binding protein FerR (iron transport regulator)